MFLNKKQIEAIRDGECLHVCKDGADVVIMSPEQFARIREAKTFKPLAPAPPTETDITGALAGGVALLMICFVCACIGASLGYREHSHEDREPAARARPPAENSTNSPAKQDEVKPLETTKVKKPEDVDEFIEARKNAIPNITDISWLVWLFPVLLIFVVGAALVYWFFK